MNTFIMQSSVIATLVLSGANIGLASDFDTHIPMHTKGNTTYYVSGSINNSVTSDFLIDTGSSYLAINRQTLKELTDTGSLEFTKEIAAVMADGSETVVPVYRIAHLKLGTNCIIQDVEAAVIPGPSPNILGLSALKKAAPFALSIDPPTLTLTSCNADSV